MDDGRNMHRAGVGCVIVNYRSPWEMLERCLTSIVERNSDTPCNVVLVDNASGDGVVDMVRSSFPDVRVIEMPDNAGFAAAVNRGLIDIDEPYVLMLNTDAVLRGGALAKMAGALAAAPDDVAGVAPKMMSSAHEGVIDAVGTVMPPTGAGFNRGIGQCDLGQYDKAEEVAGVCFGAALLRRELFEAEAVGPLYQGYFLYFEDSDWCLRATSRGYRFLTVPEAVVLHEHSGVTRHESLSFKYRLIELNTLKLVVRNFESRARVVSVVASRSARLLARTFIRRRYVVENLSTLASFARQLPMLIGERRCLARRRTVSDAKVFRLAAGENAYFDTVEYRPDRSIEALIDTCQRLRRQGRLPGAGAPLSILYRLKQEAAAGVEPGLSDTDREVFADQPPCVLELLEAALGTTKGGR